MRKLLGRSKQIYCVQILKFLVFLKLNLNTMMRPSLDLTLPSSRFSRYHATLYVHSVTQENESKYSR